MRIFVFSVLFILLLVLTLGLALKSERFVLAALEWGIDSFTSLDLELRNPRIDLFKRTASAEEIYLYQDESDGLPLISILDFKGYADLKDLINANLRETTLGARAVTVYIYEDDDVDDPTPITWLSYARWLPRKLAVGSVHVISHGQEVWVFPLKTIVGSRGEKGSFALTADADYEGEPLELALQLLAINEEDRHTGLELNVDAYAPESDSTVKVAGELRGDKTGLSYDLKLDADYKRIEDFLDGFDNSAELANGSLRIEGSLSGDLKTFVLQAHEIILDNSPAYRFQASGKLTHQQDQETQIYLDASGEIETAGSLLTRTAIDLSVLGKATATAIVSGTMTRPRIDQFTLESTNTAGLDVSASGKLSFEELRQGTPEAGNAISIKLSGPQLAVLVPWVGEIPFEPGPWQASWDMTGTANAISISGLKAEFGQPETLQLKAQGGIDSVDFSSEFSPQALEGIALQVELNTDNGAVLSQWFDLAIPPDQQLSGRGTIRGRGDNLQIDSAELQVAASDLSASFTDVHLGLAIGAENTVRVSGLRAGVVAELSDTSALSQYLDDEMVALGQLNISANLVQQGESYALENIEANIVGESLIIVGTGTVANLPDAMTAGLNVRFSGAKTENLLGGLLEDFSYGEPLGYLQGSFDLAKREQEWDISELELEASGSDKLSMTASGVIRDIRGFITADLNSAFNVQDQALLEALTGLKLNPVVGEISIGSSPGKLALIAAVKIGVSELSADVKVTHANDSITSLDVDITAPRLVMDDLGLQAEAEEKYNPAELIDPVAKSSLDRLLLRSPRYPTDILLKVGSLNGENFDIDSIDIHTTGENGRYTLRKFNLGYATGSAEVRGIIDLNPQPIAISLAGQGLNIPLNTLSKDLGTDTNVDGSATFRGGITARGTDLDQWLGSLDGSLAVALEDTVIEGAAYDLLATSMLQWIYSGAALEKTTTIDCSMLQLQIDDGIATGDSLFIETRNMVATGTVKLNLVEKTMNVELDPRSKSRRFQIPSTVTIKGDFDNPKVIASPITATADASAEALSLIPRLTMKMFGIGKNRPKQSRPCAPNPGG
ncbi:MAG: AsmA family protein [Halioglobus sp.]